MLCMLHMPRHACVSPDSAATVAPAPPCDGYVLECLLMASWRRHNIWVLASVTVVFSVIRLPGDILYEGEVVIYEKSRGVESH